MNPNKDKLVEENLKLVHYCLKKYFKLSPDVYEDCYQEGCMGLCLAAERFDETRGSQFSTYAVPMMIGTVKRYMRENNPMRISRSLLDRNHQILKLIEEGLTDLEIMQQLNLKPWEYSEALNIRNLASFDDPIGEEENLTLGDTIGVEPEESIEYLEDAVLLVVREILQKANTKQRDVYEEALFSRMWDEPVSQEYLAKKYNLSQPQVSRILRKYDKALKEKLKWQI